MCVYWVRTHREGHGAAAIIEVPLERLETPVEKSCRMSELGEGNVFDPHCCTAREGMSREQRTALLPTPL